MGKHVLRNDMTCLNCHHVVEKRFCPNCGQENKHTKESFHYLFTHFIEDFTHYDGSFWKTIKHLLFNPGKLTIEYLAGKRQTYVPPVKLYIFISFITFFLLSALPIIQEEGKVVKFTDENKKPLKSDVKLSKLPLGDFKSLATYDSVQNSLPELKKDTGIELWVKRKMAKISEENTVSEFTHKVKESIFHNLPKVIFLFLPFFALILMLFHNRKRWYYYEHGIFTFHYFSMLLLSFSLSMLLSWVLSWFGATTFGDVIVILTDILLFFWWIFYFFRSHRRFYQESKLISGLKSSVLFIINFIFMGLFLMLFLIYSALNVN